MSEAIVRYETDHGEVALSAAVVRDYLVNGQGRLTDREVMTFLELCKYQRLNPFLREAYIIKYGDNPATIVTGKEVFTKRAAKHPRFDGFEAGITVQTGAGSLERREGALLLPGESIVAGWARVYLKGTRAAVFAEASFAEYAGRKRDGTLNGTWAGKPATMIRKVALVQALREAFPEDFQGLYDSAEMQLDADALPDKPVEMAAPEVIVETGEIIEDAQTARLEALKLARFPEGRGKYPGQLVTEVVKTDQTYVRRCASAAKDAALADACALADELWTAYLTTRPEAPGVCPQCDGSGATDDGPCGWCGGTGTA